MQYLLLTHAEAADKAVMANVAAHLMVVRTPSVIAPLDRPDVGAEPSAAPLPPVAPVFAAVAAPTIAPAAIIPPPPSASTAPALPPVPVAPAAADSGVAPSNPAVSVDKNGLPWDGRIHSSTKTCNVDGTWRQKRGTDPAVVASVEAELRQLMGLPPLPVAPPPVPPEPPTPPVSSVFALGAQATPTTMAEFAMWLGSKMPAVISQAALAVELAAVQPGLDLPGLLHRPDLVPAAYAALSAKYGA